eukprot:FR740215.1.p2 GENE.FR740215.1~~FR740215.1.p2  ORF type:complete len:119 (+),score=25.94 FR740215.1:54-359(+)
MRRAAGLKPLLDDLGRQPYADLHKSLSFELGEVNMEMAEMKLARIRLKQEQAPAYRPKSAESSKVNLFLEESIAAFRHFPDLSKKFKPEPLLPLPKPPARV